MREDAFRIDHLIFGFSTGAIVSFLLFSLSNIGNESTFILIIFNLLFASVTFPLKGTLKKKMCMLLIGNVIGLAWNHIFSLFATTATSYFGRFFETLYMILNPFLNLIWIVSFWSLSVSSLNTSKTEKQV